MQPIAPAAHPAYHISHTHQRWPSRHVMLEFSAKAYQVQEDEVKVHASIAVDAEQRFPANLCLVIDVSGSMQLPAVLKDQEAIHELSILDIVVHSCRTVIHSLSAEDQLGIVTYSDASEVKLALTSMDAAGKAAAEAALQTLRADGQTNLWQGLETALDLLGSVGTVSDVGRISSALLLTDGAHGKLPCTLHTFGFGYDLDSQLLDQLSQAAGGIYVFIPDAGFVGTALVNCTGTAVTALGRNAQLTTTAEGTRCRALGYGENGTNGTVELGSIQLGQSKLFLDRCNASPASPAVVDAELPGVVTCHDLLHRVLQLCHRLQQWTIDDQLGICFQRPSLSAVVALLAALRMERPYVPLHPMESWGLGTSSERLAALMSMAKISGVLCGRHTVEQVLNAWHGRRDQVLDLDTLDFQQLQQLPLPLSEATTTEGVKGLKSATLNRLQWQWHCYPWTSTDVALARTPLVFVDHVAEIFGALLAAEGPSLVCSAMEVTRLVMTPTLLHATLLEAENLSENPWTSLRFLTSSGELLTRKLLEKLQNTLPRDCIILNLYGSTEVAADATYAELPRDDVAIEHPLVPCGRAIPNVWLEIRRSDEADWAECTAGEEGEIFIFGACLSSGYFEDAISSSADAFVTLSDRRRGFRSGDVGRWAKARNGGQTLQILGRCNQMVKVRGQRVELSLVELALTSLRSQDLDISEESARCQDQQDHHPIFSEATCCLVDHRGTATLAAAVVADPATVAAAVAETARRALAQRLPAAAVPGKVLVLAEMPRLPGGKIDRKAVARQLSASFVDDSNPIGPVADAWRSALGFGFTGFNGSEDVSFMESGGNSAGLMKLASLLRQHWPYLAYDEIMEAASVSYNSLLKLCQSSKKRKHEDAEVEVVTDTPAATEAEVGDVDPAEKVEVLQRGGTCNVGATVPLDAWRETTVVLSWTAEAWRYAPCGEAVLKLIGSHSHQLGCFDAESGAQHWRLQLSDRIEAGCACAVIDGRHRYDGKMHCMDLQSGAMHWSCMVSPTHSDTEIKSAPVIANAVAIVGTHGGTVAGVDAKSGERLWEVKAPGAVFASPAIQGQSIIKYHAAPDFRLVPLRQWLRRLSAPVFATPLPLDATSCLALSVDGVLRCLDGGSRWSRALEGNAFGTPCRWGEKIFIGTHGGYLYCITISGAITWRFSLGDVIYGAPFVVSDDALVGLVAVATRGGTVLLVDTKGEEVVGSAEMAGEVFSSPVVWWDAQQLRLAVG
eukprot:s2313_g7.t1